MRSLATTLLCLFLGLGSLPASVAQGPPREGSRPKAGQDRYGDPLPPGSVARLGTIRFRRPGQPLTHIAYSPDGKTLAGASQVWRDGLPRGTEVSFWDAVTGKELFHFRAHAGDLSFLGYSGDGKVLATQSNRPDEERTGEVRLWDPATGKLLRQFVGTACAFTPDGKALATLEPAAEGPFPRPHHLVLRDLVGLEVFRRLPLGPDLAGATGPFLLALGPDNRTAATMILSGIGSNHICVWDLNTGKALHGLRGTDLAYSADGKALAVAHGDRLVLWDLATAEARGRSFSPAAKVAFSPHGKVLAWGGSGRLYRWEPGKAAWPRALAGVGEGPWLGGGGAPNALAFAPDGKHLAVASGSAIRFWDMETCGEILPFPGHGEKIHFLTFTPDSKTLVTAAPDATILWDLDRMEERRRSASGLPISRWQLAIAPDGKTQVLPDQEGALWVVDLATGKWRSRLEGTLGGGPMLLSPDGRFLAVGEKGCSLRLLDVNSGKKMWEAQAPSLAYMPFRPEAFSRDGTLLIAMEGILSPCFLATATGKRLPLLGLELRESNVVFAPDGRTLAERSLRGGSIVLWDLIGKRARFTLDVSGWDLDVPWFSPDGRYLGALGAADGLTNRQCFLFLWDAASGRQLRHFGEAQGIIDRAEVSPNGRSVLTLDRAGKLALWELSTGKQRARFEGNGLPSWDDLSPVFSPDGRLVARASDTTVCLWDLTGRAPDGRWKPERLSPRRFQECWEALAGEDARKAFLSVWALVADPEQTLPWLRRHLLPEAGPSPEALEKLLTDLGADRFAVRDRAARERAALGEMAEPALRQALTRPLPLEVQRRIEQVLGQLGGPVTSPWEVRALRAVEVLEYLGTREAQSILRTVAQGAPAARLTREARASLQRWTRTTAAAP